MWFNLDHAVAHNLLQHVCIYYTFHVCLCLLALTNVRNSTYLLKCSFQIYQKSIVVLVLEVQRYMIRNNMHDALIHVCLAYLFLHSGQVLSSFKCYFKRKYLNLIISNLLAISGEASPKFGHANAIFSVFTDRIRNQFLKK